MRLFHTLLYPLLGLLCLSCSDDEQETGSNPALNSGAITFGVDLTGFTTRITQDGTSWTNGDKIGTYVLNAETSELVSEAVNTPYVCTEAGQLVAFTSETPLTVQDDGTPVKFVAYYPYNADIQDFNYPVAIADQSNGSTACDLLYGTTSEPYVYDKESDTRSLTYDLLHQDSLDSKLYISNIELDRSEVIVKGAKYKLEKVATVKALVDATNIPNPKAGDITLKDVPLVAYDTNGKIVDVEIVPKTVDAKITITSPSKEIPIKIVPTGKLAFGKAIKSIESSVSSVVVYGDENAVNKLEQLEVEIDVNDLKADKEYNVTLKKPSGITDLSVKINVSVDNSITKEFDNISVSAENLGSGLKAQALSEADSKITVIVEGSEDVINNLDPSTIKAYVDLKKYGVGEHEIEVLVTGSDVKLTYKAKTKKVKIRITQD